MPMRALLLLAGIILLAGCASEVQPEPQAPQPQQPMPEEPSQPAEEPADGMTCEEYCPTQPHIECVGQWNISGTYPDCTCEFICGVEETEEPEEEPPSAPVLDKTLDQILNEAIEGMKSDFYRENSGTFTETTYTWKFKQGPEVKPGDLVFDAAPKTDITFDEKTIDDLRGAAFVVFEEDDSAQAYATIVVLNDFTLLDNYLVEDAFDIDYFYAPSHGDMRDCWIFSKEIYKNTDDDWISIYSIRCERVFERD